MSVNRIPLANEFRPLTDETPVKARLILAGPFFVDRHSSVNDTEKLKNLRKNNRIH